MKNILLALALGFATLTVSASAHAGATWIINPKTNTHNGFWVTTYDTISKQQIQHFCVRPGENGIIGVPPQGVIMRVEVTRNADCSGPVVCDTRALTWWFEQKTVKPNGNGGCYIADDDSK